MIYRTYGSGSDGNLHTLTSSTGETLVLDAGVKSRKVFRDILPSSIIAVLVTHQHGDHASYIEEYNTPFTNIYAPFEGMYNIPIKSGDTVFRGEFQIKALAMSHDIPCVGYLIRHKELDGDILYATDTNGIPWKFKKLALAIIEADYAIAKLKTNAAKGIIPRAVAYRTTKTHQSISQAIHFLNNNVGSVTQAIFCHLSRDNADKELFLRLAAENCKNQCYIAEEGFVLEFNKFDVFK